MAVVDLGTVYRGVSILSDWCLIFALEYGTYIGYSSFYLHNTNAIIVFDNVS